MLDATDLSFAYRGAPVVDSLSLRVGQGQLVGLLGPNGAGKTTLLGLLAGLLRPTRGVVRLDGRPLGTLSRAEVARRLAVVPQETQLAFDYTVLEMALMGRYPHLGPFEIEGPDDLAIARAALASTGTDHLEARRFATLSGGEKQRVVIASALAQFGAASPAAGEPAGLLLLDEPTASLDLHFQMEVAGLLRRLNRERGLTMLVSTHDLNLAASLCTELVLMRDGRVIASGPTARVLTADAVHLLYGMDADVRWHDRAGHLTVVPLATA
ncbi:MAG: ABC transporter ATP-binding protein [Acidobacteria bacterium]|nr:ABC transporter ATP-binding protein [Acidobacteriota bacterium]